MWAARDRTTMAPTDLYNRSCIIPRVILLFYGPFDGMIYARWDDFRLTDGKWTRHQGNCSSIVSIYTIRQRFIESFPALGLKPPKQATSSSWGQATDGTCHQRNTPPCQADHLILCHKLRTDLCHAAFACCYLWVLFLCGATCKLYPQNCVPQQGYMVVANGCTNGVRLLHCMFNFLGSSEGSLYMFLYVRAECNF